MIVITRNGKTTVLTGWRAWLVGGTLFVVLGLVALLVTFVMLGVAVTVTAVLLAVVPVAIGVALIMSAFRKGRPS